MTKGSFLEDMKADISGTLVSYFAPVRAVIDEVSKAVSAEAHGKPDHDDTRAP